MKVKLAISTDCRLMVSPFTDNPAPEGMVWAEFIIADNINSKDTLVISEEPSVYKFTFPNDGLYAYYKILIYKKEMFGEDLDGRVYYDENTGELMLGNEVVSDFEDLTANLETTSYNIVDYAERPVFSTCRLDNCVASIERDFVYNRLKNGCKELCSKANRDDRDFLVLGAHILKLLIKQQRYGEAIELREALSTCSSICQDLDINNKPIGCGCGK